MRRERWEDRARCLREQGEGKRVIWRFSRHRGGGSIVQISPTSNMIGAIKRHLFPHHHQKLDHIIDKHVNLTNHSKKCEKEPTIIFLFILWQFETDQEMKLRFSSVCSELVFYTKCFPKCKRWAWTVFCDLCQESWRDIWRTERSKGCVRCSGSWTDWQTDRQMKQTQGPQRFAFCANQINTFNKAYRYQTAIQLYEKISQFTQFFNVQMLQKNGLQSRQ